MNGSLEAKPSVRRSVISVPRTLSVRALRSEFVRHGVLVFAGTSLANLLNYFFHFILTRLLGVVAYGEMAALINAVALVALPGSVIMLIVVKFSAELHAVGDYAKVRTFSERVLAYSAILAAVVIAGGFAARSAIGTYLHVGNTSAVSASIVLLGILLVAPAAKGLLQGVQDFKRFALASAIETGMKLLLGIGLVLLGYRVGGALAGFAAGTACGLVYAIFAIKTHWRSERVPLHLDLRRLLQTTGGIAIATFALSVLINIDVPLVKHFFSPQVAGLYSGVNLGGKVLFFIVGFVPTLILPKAVARAVRGENPLPVLVRGSAITLLISVCGLILFFAFPSIIMRVLAGSAFAGGGAYLFQYGIASALLAATTVVTTYKIALHRFDFVLPLLFVMICEVAAINLWHPTLHAVIDVLIAGNSCALLTSLYRVTAPAAQIAATGAGSA